MFCIKGFLAQRYVNSMTILLPDFTKLSPAEVGEWAALNLYLVFEEFKESGLLDGMSGGQLGASMPMLFMSSLEGWFSMVEKMPKDRLICVSKDGRIISGKL